jgi:hypothetical protein
VIVVLPVVACVPLQPPVAVQLVVLMDDHVRVVVAPAVSEVLASFKVGAPGGSAANAASAWMNPYPDE